MPVIFSNKKWKMSNLLRSWSPNVSVMLLGLGKCVRQWAAVRTYWGWINVPPQVLDAVSPLIFRCTIHGQLFFFAVTPFTTLEDACIPQLPKIVNIRLASNTHFMCILCVFWNNFISVYFLLTMSHCAVTQLKRSIGVKWTSPSN